MSNELAKLDFSQVAEGIRDRIKAAFVDSIPDEQWEALIQEEFRQFTETTKDRWNQESVAGFSQICQKLLHEAALEKIKAELEKPEWQAEWNKASDRIIEAIVGNREKFVETTIEALIGRSAQAALDAIRHGIQS
jgi:hypothetical protein